MLEFGGSFVYDEISTNLVDVVAAFSACHRGGPAPNALEEKFVPENERTTIFKFKVAVGKLLGPEEDREDWVALTLGVDGVYNLPNHIVLRIFQILVEKLPSQILLALGQR